MRSPPVPPPPPAPPATRDPNARTDRAGAPLWQVCEFQPDLSDDQRAGLEAALEAAGLLDAWIAPDGSLTVASTDLPADSFLALADSTSSAALLGPTLNDWLQPDLPADTTTVTGLTLDLVRRALARIGAGASAGFHWVALDGRWQLGAVFGRGQKPAAIHLGATGREAARRRRLAEIEAMLTALATRQEQLDTEATQLDHRATETQTERRNAPSDHDIARHLTLRTDARTQLDVAKREHAAAVQSTHRARQAAQDATETLRRDARDLGYGEHLHRLHELRPTWAPYAQAIATLWGEASAWITSSLHLDRLTARHREEEATHTQATQAAAAARTAALRAEQNHCTLAKTLGASVEEYQRELQAARDARSAAQNALDDANTALRQAGETRSAHESALPPAREKVTEAEQHRHAAILDLRVPLHHGLFAEAHPDLADIETDDWSPTRAIAIARRLDKELPVADLGEHAWTNRLNALNTQITDLRSLTGALGCQVVSRLHGEGLTEVTCHYQGTPHTPARCFAAVERERETHQRLLSDREREIIDRHLVSEVSQQLQTLIGNARQRVDEMNAEMTRCATTLGVALRLDWRPRQEGVPTGLPRVRKLLLADHAAWTDEERSVVGQFLHQLIEEERTRNPADSGAVQLQRALDYRAWHTFDAERRQNNRWERLTRKRYGTGSGGEKALMLTIPQMAAASSHYRSTATHAPRLILLDEAFAGMDKPTRAQCMGLLEAFDLDLLMTSEREWGAHATLSGIAIYQLVADADAIATTRWIWNGKKTELAPVPDSPELRSPPAPDSSVPPAPNDELRFG